MKDVRLVKQAFLENRRAAADAGAPKFTIKPCVSQEAFFLVSVNLRHDLSAPQTMDFQADRPSDVEHMQCGYPASVTGSGKSEVMQSLQMRSIVDTTSYTPNAYLQAVGGWRHWHWLQPPSEGSARTGWQWSRGGTSSVLYSDR